MKKTLFIAVFLGLLITPSMARAQTATVDDIKSAIAELQVQLQIQVLLEKISELQAQIAQVLANQETQAIQAVQLSAPVVASTPVVEAPAQPSEASQINVSYTCEGSRIKTAVALNGVYTKGLFHLNSGVGADGTQYNGGSYWYPKDWPTGFTTYMDQPGKYNYTVSLFNGSGKVFLDRTGIIEVNSCQ